MHADAYRFVEHAVTGIPIPEGIVVEIGGRDINGSIRPLFHHPYVSIDITGGPGVDIVSDGVDFVPPEPAACVVCCEVLEHSVKAPAILANAFAILQPGGVLILTAASVGRMAHSAIDGGPLHDGEFYANVSEDDLRRWLMRFTQVQIVYNKAAGDIYATARKPA